MIIVYIALEFLCGSLMFSYWLGVAAKKDLRVIGDGNPGAFNLMRSVGIKMGILGILLDFTKGYVPLVILIEVGIIKGYAVIPVAIAPVLGHAFSPFLKFKGGKAIAVTFGIWSAVTRFEVSLVYAVILAIFELIEKLLYKDKTKNPEADAFKVVSGMALLGIYLIFRAFKSNFIILWAVNLIVLVYTNKNKLFFFFNNLYNKDV